jgi:hypothetical protein
MAIDMNNIVPAVKAIDDILKELDTEDSITTESSVYSQFLFNIKADGIAKEEVETISQSEDNPGVTNKYEKDGWDYRTPADGPEDVGIGKQEQPIINKPFED